LKCERFDKLIHLFLDGRLEKDKESDLEEHLSACEKCARKLALLKSMEGAAKKIQVEEPQQEYWDTFSSRVREKITRREERSLAFGLKQALQGFFSFSPLKIKVAAGLISVVLVFIVGKLYVDYRGQEIVPRKESMQTQEQPRPDATKATQKGEVSQAEDRDRAARPPDEPKREKKAVDIEEAKKKETPPGEPISEEEIATEELGTLTAPEVVAERGVSAPAPTPDVQTLAEPEGPSKQLSEETEATGAGMKDEAKGKAAIEMPAQVKGTGKEEGVSRKAEQERTASEVRNILIPQYGFVGPDRFLLDQNMVPKMGEYDTLRQADELKRAIKIWKDYIKENPTDSLTNQGYLQVAMAYYLLAKLSQDTTVISEGKKLIETYLGLIAEPALKEKLRDRLEKIKALREKMTIPTE
jgi:hypothetical protein